MKRAVIAQHHKCATQLTRLWLEELCELNDLSLFRSHISQDAPSPSHDISLLTNSKYETLADQQAAGFIHVIRSPLSIVASAYYSHRYSHPTQYSPKILEQRNRLAGLPLEEGFEATFQYLESPEFGWKTIGPLLALYEWNWNDPRFDVVRMEDFGDAIGQSLAPRLEEILDRRLSWPEPGLFCFSALSSGRDRGEVSIHSHYRDGSSDSWKRDLPEALVEKVRGKYGPMLARYYPELTSEVKET